MKPDTTPSPDAPDVRILHRDCPFRGCLVGVHVDRLLLPDGSEAVREVVVHPGAVAIVAIPSPGSVLLVRQYRHPAESYVWEIPAGKLEPDESPFDCARRELEEETGYRASKWTPLASFFTTPGFSNEKISLFCARSLSRVRRSPDHDVTSCRSFLARDLQEMFDRGDLADAKTLLGLLWVELLSGGYGDREC